MSEWKRLNKRSMPPVDKDHEFLLARGVKTDPTPIIQIAKRVFRYGTNEPYIRFVKPFDGWCVLPEEDYKNCLWMEIKYP